VAAPRPYYVVGEKETIRAPKLNADHARIGTLETSGTGGSSVDLYGGDASTTFTGGSYLDLYGGGA
jgi:hypothetical protein